MRIQSTHTHADRGLDAYWTPQCAIKSLIALERDVMPKSIWEPAAGNGAIVKPLREAGYEVMASDIADYGLEGCTQLDYLSVTVTRGMEPFGVVTNPPFKLALEFAKKSLTQASYTALFLRTNFLESVERLEFFRGTPPARVWISSRRMPMMHRYGYEGTKVESSNTCYAWFCWDEQIEKSKIGWFDFKDYC